MAPFSLRFHRRRILRAAGLAAALFLLHCDRPPSDSGAREWQASDHDKLEERSRARAAMTAPAPAGSAADAGDGTLVEWTWRNQCATCHGANGKGDGPNGPMVNAPDLTREAWQASVQDGEIAAVIREGKNKMPAFPLSDNVTAGLVTRIRGLRGR